MQNEKFGFKDLMEFHEKIYHLKIAPRKPHGGCQKRRQNMTSVRRIDRPYYIFGVKNDLKLCHDKEQVLRILIVDSQQSLHNQSKRAIGKCENNDYGVLF